MKLTDCRIGLKVAITGASKPSVTTLLALSKSVIVGNPFKDKSDFYRVPIRDADGNLWHVPLNRICLLEEVNKVRAGESI